MPSQNIGKNAIHGFDSENKILNSPDEAWRKKWNHGPVTAPWTELTLELIVKYQLNPLRAARHLAYMHAAMHDARVLSARAGHDEFTQRVAVHGAASSVLEYLFPEEPMGRFGALGHSSARATLVKRRVMHADAAWEIGQHVARHTMGRARNDGADRIWDIKKRPAPRPGLWQPAPPLNAYRPTEPLAAEWRPWLLRHAAEFTAPPPVVFDSKEYWNETAEVLRVAQALTPEQKKIAEDWNLSLGTVTPAGVWNLRALAAARRHGLDSAHTARLFAALNTAMMDAFIACWHVKFTYWTQRPVTSIRARFKPDFTPHVITPSFPSYVSGHATVSGAAAEVLAAFFPGEAKQFQAMADEAAQSRLYGGIHFDSDNREGLRLGRQIGRRMAEHLRLSPKTTNLTAIP